MYVTIDEEISFKYPDFCATKQRMCKRVSALLSNRRYTKRNFVKNLQGDRKTNAPSLKMGTRKNKLGEDKVEGCSNKLGQNYADKSIKLPQKYPENEIISPPGNKGTINSSKLNGYRYKEENCPESFETSSGDNLHSNIAQKGVHLSIIHRNQGVENCTRNSKAVNIIQLDRSLGEINDGVSALSAPGFYTLQTKNIEKTKLALIPTIEQSMSTIISELISSIGTMESNQSEKESIQQLPSAEMNICVNEFIDVQSIDLHDESRLDLNTKDHSPTNENPILQKEINFFEKKFSENVMDGNKVKDARSKKNKKSMKRKVLNKKRKHVGTIDPIMIYETQGNEMVQFEVFQNKSNVCVIEETQPSTSLKRYFKVRKDKENNGYTSSMTNENDNIIQRSKTLKKLAKITCKNPEFSRPKTIRINPSARPCEICGKLFDGANQLQTRNSHLCSHFTKELLADLRDCLPYRCPVLHCRFLTKSKRVWMMHYGWVHKMIFKHMKQSIVCNALQREVENKKCIDKRQAKAVLKSKKQDRSHLKKDLTRNKREPSLSHNYSLVDECADRGVIGSGPCEVCGRKFSGKYADSLKVDHLCIHFQSNLLQDLKDTEAPYKCPVLNCNFKSNTITVWMYHYGTIHNMINGCIRKHLDSYTNDLIRKMEYGIVVHNWVAPTTFSNCDRDTTMCSLCGKNIENVKEEYGKTKMEHLYDHIKKVFKKKITSAQMPYECVYEDCNYVSNFRSILALHFVTAHDVIEYFFKNIKAKKIAHHAYNQGLRRTACLAAKEAIDSDFNVNYKKLPYCKISRSKSNLHMKNIKGNSTSKTTVNTSILKEKQKEPATNKDKQILCKETQKMVSYVCGIVCSICHKQFDQRFPKRYALHMSNHYKESLLNDLREEEPPFKCPIWNCDYQSNKIDKWTSHYGLVHGKIDELLHEKELKDIDKATIASNSSQYMSKGMKKSFPTTTLECKEVPYIPKKLMNNKKKSQPVDAEETYSNDKIINPTIRMPENNETLAIDVTTTSNCSLHVSEKENFQSFTGNFGPYSKKELHF